jgi:hypothetical protein
MAPMAWVTKGKARKWPARRQEQRYFDNWLQELVYAAEKGDAETLATVAEELSRMYWEALNYGPT